MISEPLKLVHDIAAIIEISDRWLYDGSSQNAYRGREALLRLVFEEIDSIRQREFGR